MSVIRVIQNKQRVTKEGTAPVYISFYLGKEKLLLPCRISVDVKKFDVASGLVKGNSKETRDTNLLINRIKSKVNDILVKHRLKDTILNKEAFMREYNNPTDYKSFHEFVTAFMKIYSRRIEIGTLLHHRSCMKKFKEYCEGLQFHELTGDFLRDYLVYMKKQLGNSDATAQRNLSTIKIYVSAAIKKGYMEQNPFAELSIKRIKSNIDYLTEEELMQFITLYYEYSLPERLQKTLSFFLFMCFTSLHISDAKAIRIDQINNGILTYYRIKNRNCKPEPIKIPISIPAYKIIEELRDNREEGVLFVGLQCDQVINRQIKEIAKSLNVNKKVSAKTGRHTFATIFLRKTKDVATLQKLLGHTNLKETMIYAHVMDESKFEGMQCFNSFTI
jgi:putative phage integrase|nr:MAG TPA: Integrase [Caudoviricetes sp.]